MIDTIKKYLGDRVFDFVILIIAGFTIAVSYPEYLVTPDSLNKQTSAIHKKIDSNVAALKIANADLELSILKKEKNDILDLIDAGKAKQRHKDRLQEVNDRIKKLEDNKTEWDKILVPDK
jgi:hypothetical protein